MTPLGNGFQSTPPAEARGDALTLTAQRLSKQFQSTPPAEARGDVGVARSLQRPECFNPLPPPKRGETAMDTKFQSIPRRAAMPRP